MANERQKRGRMSIDEVQAVSGESNEAVVREEFIEKVGLIAQREGMPRIAGRMFGLLVFDGGPYSFSEIARQLQVSRGSISSSARILEEWGVIERATKPGDRQDYFRLSDAPYATLLHRLADSAGKAKSEIGRTIEKLSPRQHAARRRLEEYAAFYGVLQESVKAAGKDLSKEG